MFNSILLERCSLFKAAISAYFSRRQKPSLAQIQLIWKIPTDIHAWNYLYNLLLNSRLFNTVTAHITHYIYAIYFNIFTNISIGREKKDYYMVEGKKSLLY